MQSKTQSLIETFTSVAIGFLIALVMQVLVAWFYEFKTTIWHDLQITIFFTVVSIIRGYYVRRFFNWLHK